MRVAISNGVQAAPLVGGKLQDSQMLPAGDYNISEMGDVRSSGLYLLQRGNQQFQVRLEALQQANALGRIRKLPEATKPAPAQRLTDAVEFMLAGGSIDEAIKVAQ